MPRGFTPSQLFRWRQQLCEGAEIPAAFNPVAVVSEPGPASPAPTPERAGVIDIEFATGGRMRITGAVDASTVAALIKALAKSKRRRRSDPERRTGLAGGRSYRHAQLCGVHDYAYIRGGERAVG